MQHQPKRHHYIPQFFLKYFSQDKANLWLFDRVKREYRFQNARKIASENKFYNYSIKGKEENLEDLFGRIESLAKPILNKLINKVSITMQEKADFSMFLAMLRVRIPEFKKWTEESGEKMYKKFNKITFSNRQIVENMIKKSGKEISKKRVDELMDFATNENRYNVKFPPNYWLRTMLELGIDLADLFIDSNWDVYHLSRNYALVTSDNPVVLVPPKNYHPFYGYGLATQGTIKVISLSSSVCLITKELTRSPVIMHKELYEKDLAKWVNKITAVNSDRFVFSPEKRKLEKLVKDTKIDTYIREQRVRVS